MRRDFRPRIVTTSATYAGNSLQHLNQSPFMINWNTSPYWSHEASLATNVRRCYVSKQSLNSHMTSHSDKNKCDKCSKRFTSASLLSVHIDRFHRKVKHHSCNTCSKLFYTPAEVNRHQRTVHLKIKRFRCHQCNLELSSRSALANHTRSVHSDEKAIVCDQCGERFKTQSQRWYHFKKMHDEYVTVFSCPLCKQIFSTKMGYRIHVKTHRPSEDVICFYCNQSFACKRNLRQHIGRIHRKPNQTCDLCGQIFLRHHKCLALNVNASIVKDREKSRRNKYAIATSQNGKHAQSVIEKTPKPDDIGFLKTDGKNWNCERCENIYTKKSNLKRHMVKKHGLAVKKLKLNDSVDTREEIINSIKSHVLENVVKERPNLVDTSEAQDDTQEPRDHPKSGNQVSPAVSTVGNEKCLCILPLRAPIILLVLLPMPTCSEHQNLNLINCFLSGF
uniref:Zinc finger protein 782 n=1 Tax=Cacopsylla melanoneura TaxID=428564 RepID=A0A8D8WPD3_9HEMI